MDILAYEQELEERIVELEAEIDDLKQEAEEYAEYLEDIQNDIKSCIDEIDEIKEELEEKDYMHWDEENQQAVREWEDSRI